MFSRLSKLIALIAAVQLVGGFWAALQCAAWVEMVARYSHEGKLCMAIEKTFDGQHPCELCKALTQARNGEKKQERTVSVNKIEMIYETRAPAIFELRSEGSIALVDTFAARLIAEPATPPPRPV